MGLPSRPLPPAISLSVNLSNTPTDYLKQFVPPPAARFHTSPLTKDLLKLTQSKKNYMFFFLKRQVLSGVNVEDDTVRPEQRKLATNLEETREGYLSHLDVANLRALTHV